ncbi:aldo/keto reductase [Bacillus sp. RG28]|uniref:Aldo/keto reductase n=1 Tax=Gottfriedia endophytica TaxID=2820819 RepID=A0A940NRL5_9BACI|nr:aldo/keto reductase [Gottfriedia endophytica]MBP0725576.1 aldo/keto reductase [Gottfriedia endophytica]
MKRVQLAGDLQFSQIIHGLWRLSEWNMTSEELVTFIEDCIELGITTFDHADIYGDYSCEKIFGEALALKPELREKMQIVTKCGIKLCSSKFPELRIGHYDTSTEHILHSVENSLKNLQINYIDLLLIHRLDPFMDPKEVANAFNQLHKEGKVHHFGVSNFLPSQFRMLQAHLDMPLVTNQIEVSPMQLEHFEKGTIDLMLEKGISPMIWSPLAGGEIFTSQKEDAVRVRAMLEEIATEVGATSIDQVMYAWLLAHPAKMMPIVGSGKIERVKTAVEATNISISREQWFRIYVAAMGHPVP